MLTSAFVCFCVRSLWCLNSLKSFPVSQIQHLGLLWLRSMVLEPEVRNGNVRIPMSILDLSGKIVEPLQCERIGCWQPHLWDSVSEDVGTCVISHFSSRTSSVAARFYSSCTLCACSSVLSLCETGWANLLLMFQGLPLLIPITRVGSTLACGTRRIWLRAEAWQHILFDRALKGKGVTAEDWLLSTVHDSIPGTRVTIGGQMGSMMCHHVNECTVNYGYVTVIYTL